MQTHQPIGYSRGLIVVLLRFGCGFIAIKGFGLMDDSSYID
jgi:hypothetical protein